MKLVLPILTAALAAALALPATAALKPGDQAPAFSAPAFLAAQPFTFTLAEALKDGPVVVYFFPAAHTPGCNLEASLFSKAVDEFKTHDTIVIGVTAGNIDELAEFSEDTRYCGGKFAVVADEGAAIAADYDALMEKRPEFSSRTSYLIGSDGNIAAVYSDSNPSRHVREMLNAAKVLEH